MINNQVIAAVRSDEAINKACKSNVKIIFDLAPSIETIEERVTLCLMHKKLLFIHIDMAEGIGKDKAGLKFVKKCGVNGVISTKSNLIKFSNELGLKTVHRMFIIDSQSVETAITMIKAKPTMAEIMPGIVSPKIIKRICSEVELPVIAGGLIETKEEIETAIKAGAVAVSTGNTDLW